MYYIVFKFPPLTKNVMINSVNLEGKNMFCPKLLWSNLN